MAGSPLDESDSGAVLARARNYPYAFPRRSFVYRNGEEAPFDAALKQGRTPVLAFGSNQSPERLRQKFGNADGHVIPVERGRLKDFDVVFSAHITSYGAVPAMLQVSEGASVELAVTWLDGHQLEIMHHSEVRAANYFFAALDGVTLHLSDDQVHTTAFAYVGTRGHLEHDEGGAIALATVPCEGRRFRSMTTAEALELVRLRHAADQGPEDFIHTMVGDSDRRAAIQATLAPTAIPFGYRTRRLS
ncbi:hypothetical protein [Hwanghaeella sp.]|uniref:hypothetical protein n=1 Tax=Hwanghaeella sp. TaxID=2605943 RepID=UPI003CCBFF1E